MATQLSSIVLITLSTVISSLASFFLKVASKNFTFQIKAVIRNFPLIGAFSLHFISAIIGIIAYRGGELTVLVPLASLNYIWASILAVRFLGEKMNGWKWAGIFTIMVGITLIGLSDIL